ncbi:MAG: MoaD/ThiS family protein [Anaerolineae bacterium]|nr:MoaD/ThiS family protein [Anaerolineae bacterium]
MQITIRLLASFRQYTPAGHAPDTEYPCKVKDNARVSDALAELPIPHGKAYTFLVNGRHAERDLVLQEGDLLSVFPAAGGG